MYPNYSPLCDIDKTVYLEYLRACVDHGFRSQCSPKQCGSSDHEQFDCGCNNAKLCLDGAVGDSHCEKKSGGSGGSVVSGVPGGESDFICGRASGAVRGGRSVGGLAVDSVGCECRGPCRGFCHGAVPHYVVDDEDSSNGNGSVALGKNRGRWYRSNLKKRVQKRFRPFKNFSSSPSGAIGLRAIVIPSGEGKTSLACERPDLFVDHDSYVDGKKLEALKRASSWDTINSYLRGLVTDDARVLLTWSRDTIPADRCCVGELKLEEPTGLRDNISNRGVLTSCAVEFPTFASRNSYAIATAIGDNSEKLLGSAPVGFWNSCTKEIRDELVTSKARMHIAENNRRVKEAEEKVKYLGSPEASMRKAISLVEYAGKQALKESDSRIYGWAKTVATLSAESLARSTPTSAPSFDELSAKLEASSQSSFELEMKAKQEEIDMFKQKLRDIEVAERDRPNLSDFVEKAKYDAVVTRMRQLELQKRSDLSGNRAVGSNSISDFQRESVRLHKKHFA